MSDPELEAFNDRLNLSERKLRMEVGDDAVDAAIDAFKLLAAANPLLQAALREHVDPYRFAYDCARDLHPGRVLH